MAAGAGQRAAGSSRSSSRSGGRLMAGAGSRPPGCGQSAGGTSAPVTAPRPRPRVGHGGDGSPAAVGARGWNPPPSPSLSLPSSPPRRPASGALPRSGGTPRGLPAALRAGPSGGPSDSGKGDPRPRRAQCPAPSGGASGAAPRPPPALPPPRVQRHPPGLGAARPGPARLRPAPRQRGRAAGRPRRGGAGPGGGGRPGGTRACRHVQTRAGTRPPASTCRRTCERAHTRIRRCAECTRAYANTHVQMQACKRTRASVRKQAQMDAHTCAHLQTHAHRTPCHTHALQQHAGHGRSPRCSPPHAVPARPLCVHRGTHALPQRPSDARTAAVPSTSLHVPPGAVPPPRAPAVPPRCHPQGTPEGSCGLEGPGGGPGGAAFSCSPDVWRGPRLQQTKFLRCLPFSSLCCQE